MTEADKRNFKINDIYKLKLPVEPRFSPDGRWAAFVLQSWDKNQDQSLTNIKLLDIREKNIFNITEGCCDKYPRFSPDGKKLAFISQRSGISQLWVVRLNGGLPRQIETAGQVISPPVWSPDSKRIAFSAFSGPRCCQESDEITVVNKFYHKFDGYGFFRGVYSQIYTVKYDIYEDEYKLNQITKENYNHHNPAWSPDGDKIAFTVMREDNLEKGVFKHDLCYYDLINDKIELIMNSRGPLEFLSWSPDGKFLGYIGHQNKYGRATTMGIWLVPFFEKNFPLQREDIINLTENFSCPVGKSVDSDINYCCEDTPSFKWTQAGNYIYFLAADRGSSYIFEACLRQDLDNSVETREIVNSLKNRLDSGDRIVKKRVGDSRQNIQYFDYLKENFIYIAASSSDPGKLFLKGNKEEEELFDFNQKFKERVSLFTAEKFVYRGAEDWKIEGWILNKDEAAAGNTPLAVVVHGGPHLNYGDTFMLQAQALAAAGYTVFYANPRGSQSYGQEFASAVVQDWGSNDFQDVMAGVEYILEKGWANSEEAAIMGWSYGGYLTCWSAAHSDRFKTAVAGGSVTNLYSFYGTSDIGYSFGEFETGSTSCHSKEELIFRSPINYVNQIDIPLLLLHGEDDLRCPISQSEELFTALRRCGKKTVLVRYPNEGHLLKKPSHIVDRWERTISWLDEHLDI